MTRILAIEVAIRALGSGQQAGLAVDLATLVEPFAQLSTRGQPKGGLHAVAEAVRVATTMADVDRARHLLWSTPELQIDDGEPEDASWYSFRATSAWIYAADSKCTSPSDGAVNAFKSVLDLLDGADQTMGDTDLVDNVLDAVENALQEGAVRLPMNELLPRIESAAARVAPLA
jgi:hypothetical protein